MKKEKQIEEMAETLDEMCDLDLLADCEEKDCSKCMATALYNAGYRKQSEGEWISVEERLPEIETPVLVFTAKGRYYVGYYYEAVTNPGFTGFYADYAKRDVTHWMPLPEPPEPPKGE